MDKENKIMSDAEQLKGFAHSTYIEKGGYTLLVRKTIYFIVAMIVVFIIWASLTNIDEVAVSFGEVMPLQDVHVIQHLQGGTIQTVFVKNGQEVLKGQPLIKLDPEVVKAELQKAQSQQISLMLNVVRLQAFLNKTPIESIDWQAVVSGHPYYIPENQVQINKSILEVKNLLLQQNNERDNQHFIFKEKITQREADLKQYEDTKSEVEKRLVLNQKEEKMYESVVDKGYVSQRDYLAAQRRTIEAIAQLKQVNSRIDGAKSAIQEAQAELKRIDAELNKKALEQLNAINTELLGVHHTIQRLSELNNRLLITAPITGIVKGLTLSSGSVISPAQGVLDIVPTGGEMIVDCRISTKDIGHVKVGDKAHIKVMAFEFTRYGSIPGHVMEISASTFTSEKGLPYYKAKITLSKNYLGDDPKMNLLKPGMTVQVDIITGEKTVLSYLIKPITRGLQTSFRER